MQLLTNSACNHLGSVGKASSTSAVVILSSLAIISCGSSSTTSGSVTNGGQNSQATSSAMLIENGSEPRVALAITEDTSRMLSITASADETLNYAGTETSDSVSGAYDLLVDLSVEADAVSVALTPIVKSYSLGDADAITRVLENWKYSYSTQGELINYEAPEDVQIVRHNTLGVFDPPDIVLPVPADAIGVGAKWTYDSRSPQGLLTRTFTVTELTDSIIKVDETATVEPANRIGSSERTATRSGTYDVDSLLLIDMQATLSTGFESEFSKNQQTGQLTSVINTSFSVAEAKP